MNLGNGLPAGLGEPLHMLEPSSSGSWWWALAGLVLAWLFRRWLRRRLAAAPAPSPTPPALAPQPVGSSKSVLDALAELRKRHGRNKSFREGCHELAATLRNHFARRTVRGALSVGPPLKTLTAREIEERLGDPFVGSLFHLLEELQFRRQDPDSKDFYGVCDLASEAVEGRAAGDSPKEAES